MKTKSDRKLIAVHSYGNRRDLTSHAEEQRHQLAVELEGVDHAVSFADIPLCITSSEDDGPEVTLTEADTLAIADEIARRCSVHGELVAALKEYRRLYEAVEPGGGWQGVYELGNAAISKAESH